MEETTWVRSTYLYVMCFVSIILIGVGAVGAAVGLVHVIIPDLGHRDAIDRIGIGLGNIAEGVVDIANQQATNSAEEYCDDWQDDDYYDSRAECMDQNSGMDSEGFGAINEGISEVRNELRGQIRNSSISAVIKGLLAILAGLVLFRIHGGRTLLFANGIGSLKKRAIPAAPAPPVDMV